MACVSMTVLRESLRSPRGESSGLVPTTVQDGGEGAGEGGQS